MSNGNNQTVNNKQNSAKGNTPPEQKMIKIPIDGTRVTIEIVVAVCHIISFLMIAFTEGVSSDIRWTLLTLCITTFSTIIQFQNEGRWRFSGNPAFKIPFWSVLGMMTLIVASYIVPQLAGLTESKGFAILVSSVVTVRQCIHAKMIYDIFVDEKKET